MNYLLRQKLFCLNIFPKQNKITKAAIKIDGNKVASEKKVIYLRLALELFSLLELLFIILVISIKIKIKKIMITAKSIINRFCKLASFNLIKLRSINVKKVKIPKKSVIEKIRIIILFLFIKFNMVRY